MQRGSSVDVAWTWPLPRHSLPVQAASWQQREMNFESHLVVTSLIDDQPVRFERASTPPHTHTNKTLSHLLLAIISYEPAMRTRGEDSRTIQPSNSNRVHFIEKVMHSKSTQNFEKD